MLKISNEQLVYVLRPIEVIGAVRFSPKMPISALKSVTLEEQPWTSKVLRGFRAPGTGIPYVIMLGTMRHRRGKDFCVVYRRNPVLVLEFEGRPWARWVIPANPQNKSILSETPVGNA